MKTSTKSLDWGLTTQRLLAVAALLAIWQVVIWSGTLPSMTPGVRRPCVLHRRVR